MVDGQVERRESFLQEDLFSPGLAASVCWWNKGKMTQNDFFLPAAASPRGVEPYHVSRHIFG